MTHWANKDQEDLFFSLTASLIQGVHHQAQCWPPWETLTVLLPHLRAAALTMEVWTMAHSARGSQQILTTHLGVEYQGPLLATTDGTMYPTLMTSPAGGGSTDKPKKLIQAELNWTPWVEVFSYQAFANKLPPPGLAPLWCTGKPCLGGTLGSLFFLVLTSFLNHSLSFRTSMPWETHNDFWQQSSGSVRHTNHHDMVEVHGGGFVFIHLFICSIFLFVFQ